MELYPGKKVRIKVYNHRPGGWNSEGRMDKYMGNVVTIKRVVGPKDKDLGPENYAYVIEESGYGWHWRSWDFEEVIDIPDELFEI